MENEKKKNLNRCILLSITLKNFGERCTPLLFFDLIEGGKVVFLHFILAELALFYSLIELEFHYS